MNAIPVPLRRTSSWAKTSSYRSSSISTDAGSATTPRSARLSRSRRMRESGRNCKISSHTFVCEGVTIEDEVFIGHGVTFINDMYPRATTAGGSCRRKRIGAWTAR